MSAPPLPTLGPDDVTTTGAGAVPERPEATRLVDVPVDRSAITAGLVRLGAELERTGATAVGRATAATAAAAPRSLTPREVHATALAGRVTDNVLTRIALALAGMSPTAGAGPAAPAVPSSALLVLQWALFRRGENPLFNRTPVAVPTQTAQDAQGDVTVDLHATDPDGDHLTYTVTTPPARGSLTLVGDGVYRYEPGAALAAAGGTDTFVVTIRDNTPGARGLGAFTDRARAALAASNPALATRLFGAHERTERVTVHIDPVAPPVVGVVDATTGVSRGNLGVVAGSGERLVFTVVEAPKHGTFVVDAAGNWTYTPTAAARLAAARTAGPDYDTFSVLVERVPAAGQRQARLMLLAAGGQNSSGTVEIPPAQAATPAVTATLGADGFVGPRPHIVQASPNGHDLYLAHLDGSFTVVDTTTGTTTPLPVNGNRLEFTADGARAVTVGYGPGGGFSLFVVDTATNDVIGTVPVGGGPSNVVFTPAGDRALVLDYSSGDLTVVDLVTGARVATVAVGTNATPILSSDGGRAWFLDAASGDLTVVDTSTGAEIDRVRGAFVNGYATITADGTRAIVTNNETSTVAVVDTATLEVLATHTFGSLPSVYSGPDGSRLYVVPDQGGQLSVIDTTTGDVVATVPIGGDPGGLWLAPDGSRAYLADRTDGGLRVIDLTGDTPVRTVTVGRELTGVQFAGDRAYVVDRETGRVTVLDTTADLTADPVVRVVDLGVDPSSGVLSPDGASIWFAGIDSTVTRIDTRDDTVTPFPGHRGEPFFSLDGAKAYLVRTDGRTDVLDTATGAVTATLDAVPWGATSPDGRYLYVSDFTRGEVTFVSTLDDSAVVFPVVRPTEVSFSADGSRAYVASSLTGTVTVVALDGPVTPVVAPAPSAPLAVGAPAADTAVVAGDLGFRDPGLVYQVTTRPTLGNVTLGPDGTFRYEPTVQARRDAALTAGPDVDVFTITAYDGRGGRADVPVTVTVAPLQGPAVTSTVATGGFSGSPVFAPGDEHAWVVSYRDGTATRIDPTTGESTTFAAGGAGGGLLFSADGARAYLAGPAAGTVTVIDAKDGTVVDTVAVDGSPTWLTLSPDGGRLYVTGYDGRMRMTAIDTATGAVVGEVWSGGGGSPYLTFAPGVLYISDPESGRITALDTATDQVRWTRDVTPYQSTVQVGPVAGRAYVVHGDEHQVSIIDTATGTVVDTVDVGGHPLDELLFSAHGTRAWATSVSGGTVAVIDTTRDAVLDVVAVGRYPARPRFAPDGSRAYVTGYDGTVTVIDPVDARVVDTITVGANPRQVVFAPDGATAWVSSIDGGTVTVIDVATDRVVDTITVGAVPLDVVFSPDGTRAVLVAYEGGTMTVLDTATRDVVGVVPVGADTAQVRFSPDGTRLYLAQGFFMPTTLAVVDMTTLETVPLAGLPPVVGVPELTPDGRYVYVAGQQGEAVLVSTADDTVTVVATGGASALTPSPDGRYLYAVDVEHGTTSVILLPSSAGGSAGDVTLA